MKKTTTIFFAALIMGVLILQLIIFVPASWPEKDTPKTDIAAATEPADRANGDVWMDDEDKVWMQTETGPIRLADVPDNTTDAVESSKWYNNKLYVVDDASVTITFPEDHETQLRRLFYNIKWKAWDAIDDDQREALGREVTINDLNK